MSIPPEIILSAHRALIGAIPKTLRGLTISYTDGALHWKAYFETHPTTEEQDALSTACTEIVADILHQEGSRGMRLCPLSTAIEHAPGVAVFKMGKGKRS